MGAGHRPGPGHWCTSSSPSVTRRQSKTCGGSRWTFPTRRSWSVCVDVFVVAVSVDGCGGSGSGAGKDPRPHKPLQLKTPPNKTPHTAQGILDTSQGQIFLLMLLSVCFLGVFFYNLSPQNTFSAKLGEGVGGNFSRRVPRLKMAKFLFFRKLCHFFCIF